MSENTEVPKTFTKQEVKAFLADISEQVEGSQGNYLVSMLALNEVVRQPNAEKVFDENLKRQAREVWLKIKSSGLELNDPPLLFGYQVPENKNSPSTKPASTKDGKSKTKRSKS